MKKIVLYCLAGLLAATPVFSQNADDELKKLRKDLRAVEFERDSLQLDVDNLKSDLEGKTSEYNKLKSLYDNTKAAYENLKSATDKSNADNLQKDFDKQKKKLEDEIKNLKKIQKNLVPKDSVKTLERRINKLNGEKGELKRDNENLRKKADEVDGLKKRIESLEKDSLAKATSINELNAYCNKAKKELDALKAFKVEWLKDLAANVDNEWLSKKYSQVDMARLEDAYAQYEEFGKNDKEVAAARDKMKPFVEKCRLFAKGTAAINSPYDKVLVDSIVPLVKAFLDSETDKARIEELEVLDTKLYIYEVNVEAFQDLKKDIDNVIAKRAGQKHKVVYPMVKAVISNYEEDGTIADIQNIPYLKQQYEKYTEALEADCMKEYTLELIKN